MFRRGRNQSYFKFSLLQQQIQLQSETRSLFVSPQTWFSIQKIGWRPKIFRFQLQNIYTSAPAAGQPGISPAKRTVTQAKFRCSAVGHCAISSLRTR